MAMVINEAKDFLKDPPPGFPICSDFKNDSSIDKEYVRKGKDLFYLQPSYTYSAIVNFICGKMRRILR